MLAVLLSAAMSGLPPIKDYGLKPYVRMNVDLPHQESKPWKLVCELPYNCQFQPWLEADGPAGKTILFDSSNPLVRYLTPTERCTTVSGDASYEARSWVSGEGAVYTVPAGLTVKAVKFRETGYDTSVAGSFRCNDEDYNILWHRAARTAYLCMRDHFYDCPDRERTGFWGDGTPELDQCFYIFDRKSDELCKQLVLRTLEPSFYPGQHLEFLGDYGLWFYYMQTGDLASLARMYASTRQFLLNTYRFGNPKTWFDWGADSKDTAVTETCFAYIDLKALRRMAVLTGHHDDLPTIDGRLGVIKSTFDARYWKGGYYRSDQVSAPDDRANAMAINAGLAGPDKWKAIYDRVLSTTTNSSCFFDRWVFEALCRMGRQDEALLRMAHRYRSMIESDFSTLWEHYDRWWASWLNAFDEGSSLNHGWNPPALLLSCDIAGIRPVEPGWKVFEVMPKEAFLRQIDVTVPSINGPVHVFLAKTAQRYALQVQVPAKASAVVGIPRRSFKRLDSVSVGTHRVWTHRFVGRTGVGWAGDEGGYLRFRVGPGRWRFVAKGILPTASPKPPRPKARSMTNLDMKGWTASASVPDGTYPFSGAKIPVDVGAANAIDGDHWTGWRDMTTTQHPGQWLQVDMKSRRAFDEVVLDCTWALFDYPRLYRVTVSDDGRSWRGPVAQGSGHLGITKIRMARQRARFIRIEQTGADKTYHWSVFDLSVRRTR